MFIGSSTTNVSIFSHYITYILSKSKVKKFLFTVGSVYKYNMELELFKQNNGQT
jgi:hypothetical protein